LAEKKKAEIEEDWKHRVEQEEREQKELEQKEERERKGKSSGGNAGSRAISASEMEGGI